jgi:hypothetical protein
MHAQLVVFSCPKEGCPPADWEDGAAGGTFGGTRGGDPPVVRFAVADGATETYESRRWVELLLRSFMSADRNAGPGWPDLERGSMSAWFKAMQEQWWATAPAGLDYIEQLKIRQGTLATFVGGQITGLGTATPVWQATALGDSVLFHVRNGTLVEHFPALRSTDFDSAPEGIATLPDRLGRMSEQLLFREGRLAPGDQIFVATDALAKWMLARQEAGDQLSWRLLGELAHPATFSELIAASRGAKPRSEAMKDDDVTLMRIRLLAKPASTVVVCL